MPLFGAHMSIAGGLHNAVAASAALNCQTLQLFTKNANQWLGKPLTDAEINNLAAYLVLSVSRHRQPASDTVTNAALNKKQTP